MKYPRLPSLKPIIRKAQSFFSPDPPAYLINPLVNAAEVMQKAHSVGFDTRMRANWEKYYLADHNLRKQIDTMKEEEAMQYRKAIASTSIYPNIYGTYRKGFNRHENDRLAQNATYALCEKSIQDYVSALEWTVKDRDRNEVTDAIDFLESPNKDDTLNDIVKMTCRDITRYDAGVWVKTLNKRDELLDFKAYYGPEFWIGIDRELQTVENEYGMKLQGFWSHGYREKFWQHSQQGVYIEFQPDEVSYFMMYPRTDTPYGTDFINHLRWYLETLLDSTKAAGMTFANGMNPGTVWKHPDISSFQQLAERKAEIELDLIGPDNFGGILHLIGNEELQHLTPTMVDMQWLQGQKFISEIVWSMFGFSPADFGSGDMNRATAYIQTNVTKSRMLFPLISLFETRINRDILPYLPGYKKGWKFEYIPSVSLDDDQKRSSIKQTRAMTYSTLLQTGMAPKLAAKISELGDDLATNEIEELEGLENQTSLSAMFGGMMGGGQDQGDDSGMGGEAESYDGTDTIQGVQQASAPVQKGIVRKGRVQNDQQRLDIYLHVDVEDVIQKARGNFGHLGRPGKRGGSISRSMRTGDKKLDGLINQFHQANNSAREDLKQGVPRDNQSPKILNQIDEYFEAIYGPVLDEDEDTVVPYDKTGWTEMDRLCEKINKIREEMNDYSETTGQEPSPELYRKLKGISKEGFQLTRKLYNTLEDSIVYP
jgi:hypothetical protein